MYSAASPVILYVEVEQEENVEGAMFDFAYPLADGGGELVVSTIRPETMLGDTAVAIHPYDARYRHLHGKYVRHPFVDRLFPVILDAELVDPEFGTGVVEVTPAHDPNDFATGKRHGLEEINICCVQEQKSSDSHSCYNPCAVSLLLGLQLFVAPNKVFVPVGEIEQHQPR